MEFRFKLLVILFVCACIISVAALYYKYLVVEDYEIFVIEDTAAEVTTQDYE